MAHGIRVDETPTSIIALVESDVAVQIVIGTAPVNRAIDLANAVNNPILTYGFDECVTKLGYDEDFNQYTLCQSMDLSYRVYGIAPVIFINVLDPAVHKTAVEAADYQINNGKAIIPRKDAILSSIQIADAVIDEDYVLAWDENYNVVVHIVAGGALDDATNINASFDVINPLLVAANDIIGGYNAVTQKYKGLELISRIYPMFGIVPGIIVVPKFSAMPEVNAVIDVKKHISGVFKTCSYTDVDTTNVRAYDQVNAWKNANNYTDKDTILCFPMCKIGGKKYNMSAAAAAAEALNISQNQDVPYVSPSNIDSKLTALCLADDTEVFLDLAQANYLNDIGVYTAVNINGMKFWGNETACYPQNSDPKDRFIASRMMFNWWSNTFVLTYFSKVDRPGNRRLIDQILDTENLRANGFTANQQIAGAKITFDGKMNPITNIIDGTYKFKQYLTTYPPAKEIINELEYDPAVLEQALGIGG